MDKKRDEPCGCLGPRAPRPGEIDQSLIDTGEFFAISLEVVAGQKTVVSTPAALSPLSVNPNHQEEPPCDSAARS